MIHSLKALLLMCCISFFSVTLFAQAPADAENLPTDYLSKDFHAGRRAALRAMMPANSVAVFFSYPVENFSKDVDYVFHQNPDLFYLSGYTEPNSVLLIFKDMQGAGDSSYNELFFVQHRDPMMERWTGKRLGVEGVKAKIGFKNVYNSEAFEKFPLDLSRYSLIVEALPDTVGNITAGGLKNLVTSFVKKSGMKAENKNLQRDLDLLYTRGNAQNLPRIVAAIKPKMDWDAYKNDSLIQELMAHPDSATLKDVKGKYARRNGGSLLFVQYMNALRGIKTPEELVLLKKSVELSSIAHAEAMRAVNPGMSERELEGIMLYVHKKYGAEEEGYPPIVGAGGNGCILHYEENDAMQVKNQLVLMDVGAMYHGYSADVTRTFPANGKFTNEQKIIYQLVYDAQEAAFKVCREGIPFDSMESVTRRVLATGLLKLGLIANAADVRKYYPHGMSHHLGLDVHDRGNYDTLRENMVVTVEPGIYIPAGSPVDKKWWDIGVRIEDDVLVGKTGCTILSIDAPRKWEDVEKMVAEKSIFDSGQFPALK